MSNANGFYKSQISQSLGLLSFFSANCLGRIMSYNCPCLYNFMIFVTIFEGVAFDDLKLPPRSFIFRDVSYLNLFDAGRNFT